MALADLFYPGNPERRRTVVKLSERLATLMESNFKRTNNLIDCIHEYIPGKRFSKIRVDRDADLRTNCRMIQDRLHQIENYVQEKASFLKRKIDSSAYKSIMSVDTSFTEKFRIAKNIVRVCDIVLSIGAIVVVACVASGVLLAGIAASIGVVMTSVFAGVVFAALLIGFDAIFSFIIGAKEKQRLEETIEELENILHKFEPASDKFNRDVERLIMEIEDNC